jgi:hypothetical protein
MPLDPPEPNRPFRWDLVDSDQLGSLLDTSDAPDLWFKDELVRCAARVVARSADGEIHFVGRSSDSIHDLLGGALAETSWRDRIHILPLSLRWDVGDPSPTELRHFRANLTDAGLAPAMIARAGGSTVFVDLVAAGSTFGGLFRLLHAWIAEERAPWGVIRRKLRFIGITRRTHTSPKTWRWQQHAAWTAELPARAVCNVSLDPGVWNYLGNDQPKLTPSFHRGRWADRSVRAPQHDGPILRALREAVALVQLGRTPALRRTLARHIAGERTFAARWLRTLVLELRA